MAHHYDDGPDESLACRNDEHRQCDGCGCGCHKPAEPPRTPEPGQAWLMNSKLRGDGGDPELTRSGRNALGEDAMKATRKNRDVIVHDSQCAECGSSFDNRLHKGCPRCAMAAVEGLLRWVYGKAEKIHAETVPMGSDYGHGAAAKLSGEILQRIREGVPAERPDPRLAELLAARNVLKATWADTVRCNGPLAAAIEKTLAAVAAFEEAPRG